MNLIILLVILYIIFIIIYSIAEENNIGKHKCTVCKEIKKGVKVRNVYLERLEGVTYPIKGLYYCNDCFKKLSEGRSFILIKEEHSFPPDYPDSDL